MSQPCRGKSLVGNGLDALVCYSTDAEELLSFQSELRHPYLQKGLDVFVSLSVDNRAAPDDRDKTYSHPARLEEGVMCHHDLTATNRREIGRPFSTKAEP